MSRAEIQNPQSAASPSTLALLRLAEGWREKAAGIELRHGAAAPNLVRHVTAALECCAEELEDLANGKHEHQHELAGKP